MDEKFLLDKSEWPKTREGVPYCCLKKIVDNNYEHGFLFDVNPPVLFLGGIWDGGTGETVSYDSLDQLLSEGWIVD